MSRISTTILLLAAAIAGAEEKVYSRPTLVLAERTTPTVLPDPDPHAWSSWWTTVHAGPGPGHPLSDPGIWEATPIEAPASDRVLRVMVIPGSEGTSYPVQVPTAGRAIIGRLVILTDDGRLYATPPLQAPDALRPALHISPRLFTLRSKTAGIAIDATGRATTQAVPDLEAVAVGGLTFGAIYRDGDTEGTLRVLPDFAIPGATARYDGAPGNNGASGKRGTPGRDGSPGRSGMDGEGGRHGRTGSLGGRGEDGGNGGNGGNGGDGEAGGHAADATHGADAPEVSVTVRPVSCPFFAKPLARYDLDDGEVQLTFILPWGHPLAISARGGDGGVGGPGGAGGRGGHGGAGGAGGDGGHGGDGGNGSRGQNGQMGRPGGAGTNGGDGGDGGPGGPGGDGGPGGNGGIGGNGGSGGVGGAGGKGGKGGNGGNGGLVTVIITGDGEFQAMVKQAVSVDVAGGKGGLGGSGGTHGERGTAGSAGTGGSAGRGGDGGAGGSGGSGGMGGLPGTRQVEYTDYIYTADGAKPVTRYRVEITDAGSAGSSGPDGRDGVDGPDGASGRAGLSGTAGKPGIPGTEGAPGVNAGAGKVVFTAPHAKE